MLRRIEGLESMTLTAAMHTAGAVHGTGTRRIQCHKLESSEQTAESAAESAALDVLTTVLIRRGETGSTLAVGRGTWIVNATDIGSLSAIETRRATESVAPVIGTQTETGCVAETLTIQAATSSVIGQQPPADCATARELMKHWSLICPRCQFMRWSRQLLRCAPAPRVEASHPFAPREGGRLLPPSGICAYSILKRSRSLFCTKSGLCARATCPVRGVMVVMH